MDGLPSSQATSCPERATLIRLTNVTVGEGGSLRGRQVGLAKCMQAGRWWC